MEANSSLLHYYVHKMIRDKNNSSADDSQSTASKIPAKFRKKTTRSFLVHQYNFLKQVANQDSSERVEHSPYQQVRELVRRFDGLNLSVKKYKHHKRNSLQDEQQKAHKQQLQELQKTRLSELEFQNPSHLTVSAVRVGTPANKEKNLRMSMLQQEYPRVDSAELRTPLDLQRPMKKSQLRKLFGLEVRRMELQKERLDHTQKEQKECKQELPCRTLVMSQECVRSKRKAIEVKTIPSLKEQSLETVFEQKARNYRQLMFLIYIGCGAFKDIEPCSQKYQRKKDIKYQFYVGRGNNCNLIKSIMKRRWWWTLSNEITPETKFVWTQRKVNNFIERQNTTEEYLPADKKLLQDLPALIENEGQLLKLLHQKDVSGYKSYVKCLRKQPHSITTRMKIFGKKPFRQIESQPLVHNHLQYNNHIGNKKALLKNMTNWYKFNCTPIGSFNIPRTFHVKSQQDIEFKQFCLIFRQKEKSNKDGNIWIIKPGQNSNRGQGIKVSRNLKNILSIIQNKKHTYVIQQYITDLFLYNRRKFDIRTYMLITRLAGVMKVYWYEQGYIRTSSQIYQLDDLSNSMVHLTNDAIQKYGQNYGRYQPGNKISYLQFQKYLDIYYSGKGYSIANLVASMKAITCQAIHACYFRLDPSCRYSNFEIFGLDFLVDTNFKPWLLEVNTNPCLELSSSLLTRIIPQMVQNSFKIGLDPIYPPTACPHNSKPYLSDSVLYKNRFELIFDSQYDRNKNYQNSFPTDQCKYEDDDQLYENDGQPVIVQD